MSDQGTSDMGGLPVRCTMCGEKDMQIEQLRAALGEATEAVIWMSGLGSIPPEATYWATIRDEQMPRWLALGGGEQ